LIFFVSFSVEQFVYREKNVAPIKRAQSENHALLLHFVVTDKKAIRLGFSERNQGWSVGTIIEEKEEVGKRCENVLGTGVTSPRKG